MDQTRIIIKNIPKFLKDKELAEQFSSVGDMTDCKILRTVKGKSRGFAFVGYKTHEEAQKAVNTFNNTFVSTSKIQVDFAKPIGDESLDDCYARIRKNPKPKDKSSQRNDDDDTKRKERSVPQRPSLEDDPDYQEFLAARKARNVRPSWNDGLVEFLEKHEKEISKEKEEKEKESENSEDNDNEEAKEGENDLTKYKSTRVYVTNLPYSTTEESLEKFFTSHYGAVSGVQLLYDKIAQRPNGKGFVTFSDYDGIISAMKDSVIFEGRHLKLEPAEAPPNHGDDNGGNAIDDDESFASKKRRRMKEENPDSWNALFLNKDTVAEATAHMLGFTKSQILNPESDDIATRLAIAESQLVNDTKEMFQKAGIDLSLFDKDKNPSQAMSKTLLIVKNLKYETTEEEVRNMFEAYGSLTRFVFPPTHAVALVEFARPEDARKAKNGLSYKKIHDQPMYIQWAPAERAQIIRHNDEDDDEKIKQPIKQLKTTTLIMKNVPFKATKKEIYDLVNAYARVKAVRMIKKADGSGHRGFVFLDFNTSQEATSAMENLANVHLYDRHLVVQPAEVGRNVDSIVQETNQK